VDEGQPSKPTLDYHAEHTVLPPLVNLLAVVLMLPMVAAEVVAERHLLPWPASQFAAHWFWAVRAFAMVSAILSIVFLPREPVVPWNWWVRVNLLINIPGLAICTFAILRFVIINMPGP
jgi:hypothetical protein